MGGFYEKKNLKIYPMIFIFIPILIMLAKKLNKVSYENYSRAKLQ